METITQTVALTIPTYAYVNIVGGQTLIIEPVLTIGDVVAGSGSVFLGLCVLAFGAMQLAWKRKAQ